MSNCDRCGRVISGRGRCRDCQLDDAAEADANVCSEDGCHADTAFMSPFCEEHDV